MPRRSCPRRMGRSAPGRDALPSACSPPPPASLPRRAAAAPPGLAPAPDRLRWTSQVSSRLFSIVSPLYDEVAKLDGYGEALEQALLDLRGTPSRILDVATGTGFAARRLKRQYPEAEVTGIDVSPEMVAIAQHNAVAE